MDAGGPVPLLQPDLTGGRRFVLRAAVTMATVAEDEPSRAVTSRPRQPGASQPRQPHRTPGPGSRQPRFGQRRAELPQGTSPYGAPVRPPALVRGEAGLLT